MGSQPQKLINTRSKGIRDSVSNKFVFRTDDSKRTEIRRHDKDMTLISTNSRKEFNYMFPTSRENSTSNIGDEFIQNKYKTLFNGFFK
jgi:hypothetical protein